MHKCYILTFTALHAPSMLPTMLAAVSLLPEQQWKPCVILSRIGLSAILANFERATLKLSVKL